MGILAAVFGRSADHAIAKREGTTIGVTTAHTKSHASRYQYTFSVNGEKLDGSRELDELITMGHRQVSVFGHRCPSVGVEDNDVRILE
jgi:hypothetical protein